MERENWVHNERISGWSLLSSLKNQWIDATFVTCILWYGPRLSVLWNRRSTESFIIFWFSTLAIKSGKAIQASILRHNFLRHILALCCVFFFFPFTEKNNKLCPLVGVPAKLEWEQGPWRREWAFVSYPVFCFLTGRSWLLLPSLCLICGRNNPLEKWRVAWPLICLCPESTVTRLMKSTEEGPSAEPVNSQFTVWLILFGEYRLSFC